MICSPTPANLKGSNTIKKFYMGRIECHVSTVDSFGTEPHYGFTWRDDSGHFHSGWMPCSFVENFTGHTKPGWTATEGI